MKQPQLFQRGVKVNTNHASVYHTYGLFISPIDFPTGHLDSDDVTVYWRHPALLQQLAGRTRPLTYYQLWKTLNPDIQHSL